MHRGLVGPDGGAKFQESLLGGIFATSDLVPGLTVGGNDSGQGRSGPLDVTAALGQSRKGVLGVTVIGLAAVTGRGDEIGWIFGLLAETQQIEHHYG